MYASLAPPFIEGPEGAVDQGWVTFQASATLVVDVPEGDSILPFEVADAIRHHEGLVQIVAWPETEVPSVREVHSHLAGNVCPECLEAKEDWDVDQWLWFLSEQRAKELGGDDDES